MREEIEGILFQMGNHEQEDESYPTIKIRTTVEQIQKLRENFLYKKVIIILDEYPEPS